MEVRSLWMWRWRLARWAVGCLELGRQPAAVAVAVTAAGAGAVAAAGTVAAAAGGSSWQGGRGAMIDS